MARVSEATKAEHRQRLLDAAAREFSQKGFDGARVDEISLAAGLAKGTIYNYFESKQQVFREVVSAWFERVVQARAPLPDDATTRDRLLAIVEAEVRVVAELEEFAKVAYREVLRGTSDAARLIPQRDPVDEAVVDALRQGQLAGDVRVDRSARLLASVFAAQVSGMLVEHWLPDSAFSLDDIPSLVVDFYLEGASN